VPVQSRGHKVAYEQYIPDRTGWQYYAKRGLPKTAALAAKRFAPPKAKMPRMKATGQMDKSLDSRPTSLDNRPDFMEIQEAAKALDLSVDALRKRIVRGKIEAAKENGHWYVQILDNGLDNVQTSLDSDRTSLDSDYQTTQDQVDGKELAIAAMEARIMSLERQLEAREREVGQLHHLLAQTALNAAPARPWWRFWK